MKKLFFIVVLCLVASMSIEADEIARIKTLAEQGNVSAQQELAEIYHLGRGVPINYSEAIHWYIKAAEQGDIQSQYNLGWNYQIGQIVTQDYTEAKRNGN